MHIIIPDMGHGNCVGFFSCESDPLLIDCGTKDVSKIKNFTSMIDEPVRNETEVDLVITHYHYDHYNILNDFPDQFFSNTYLPALPEHTETGQVLMRFLSLASTLSFKNYYLSTIIWRKTRTLTCLTKGDDFTSFGKNWLVLWPDYDVIDSRNVRKIRKINRKINDMVENLSDEEQEEFHRVYYALSRSYSTRDPNFEFNVHHNERTHDNTIITAMKSIEKSFKTLANRSSLVFYDDDIDFLFTGDIDDVCLNRYLKFHKGPYKLIEAPHHGGYFGQAFNNVETEYLLISRASNYKPHCSYFQDIYWKTLIDTARNGNSILHPDLNYLHTT